MKIKKGFFKNNWMMVLASLLVIYTAAVKRESYMIVLAALVLFVVITRYLKYDALEQEADDWWKALSKEGKQKVKGKGVQ